MQGSDSEGGNAEATTGQEGQETATIRLLNTVQVPGRHSKLVRAKVDSCRGSESLALFESDYELNAKDLSIADAAIEPRSDHSVTLIVENESFQPVWLKKGQVLGKTEPVSLVGWSAEPDIPVAEESREDAEGSEVGTVLVQVAEMQSERGEHLLSTLGYDNLDLSDEEKQQLKELVLEFSDVFSLGHKASRRFILTGHLQLPQELFDSTYLCAFQGPF